MMKKMCGVLGAALLAACGWGATTIRDVAKAAGKGTLVYCYGSDWSPSGRDVLKAFRSPAFTKAVANGYVLGVSDAADVVTPAIMTNNLWSAPGDLGSLRLPALFACDKDGHGFLALENIPQGTTPAQLLGKLRAAEKTRDQAARLLAASAQLKGTAAAEKIGAALELLAGQVGDARVTADNCHGAAFARLAQEDPEDATSWQRRFTLGNCTALIDGLSKLRRAGRQAEAKAYLAREQAKSQTHLTTNQRQGVALLEWALYRSNTVHRASNIALLDKVAAMDRNTLWGEAAVGILRRLDETKAKKYLDPPKPMPTLKARKTLQAAKTTRYDALLAQDLKVLRDVSADKLERLTPLQQQALVRAYILGAVGRDGYASIETRQGSHRFLTGFFTNRSWMEEFAGSGQWHFGASDALSRLDTFAWNLPGVYTNSLLRKAATAFSMNFPQGTNDVLAVETLRIFDELNQEGRLHDRAQTLDVYGWRYLYFPWDRERPEDLRAANWAFNTSYAKLFKAGWRVPYRIYNCFGDKVFNPAYYAPWAHRRTRYGVCTDIGGVCNMISSYAVTLGHAHGLMAVTAGQPAHCAFLVRPEKNGPRRWERQYNISYYTQGRWTIFKRGGGYQHILLGEDLYEGSSLAKREFPRWLAQVRWREAAKDGKAVYSETVAKAFRRAMENVPGNYPAGDEWAGYLTACAAPISAWEEYADCVLATTAQRIPAVTQLLQLAWQAFIKAGERARAVASAERLLETIREEPGAFPEPPDFNRVFDTLAGTFEGDRELNFQFCLKALAAQKNSKNYFAQCIQRGIRHYLGREAFEKRFLAALGEALGNGGTASIKQWRSLIAELETRNNSTAVAQIVKIMQKFFPPPAVLPGATPYPAMDFGDHPLVSNRSIVRLSKAHVKDCPERHQELIDGSPRRRAAAPVVARPKNGTTGAWVGQRLGGDTEVFGMRVVGPELAPYAVSVSEDGKTWTPVGHLAVQGDVGTLDLTAKPRRTRYVRVEQVSSESGKKLALEKFMVYGKRLY